MKTRLPLSLASWLFAVAMTSITVASASPAAPLSGNIELNGIYDATFIYNDDSYESTTITLTGSSTLSNVDREKRLFTSSGQLTFKGAGQSLTMHDNTSEQPIGGAIYAEDVVLEGLGGISFIGNTAISSPDSEDTAGGAIAGSYSVTISGTTGDILFEGNTLSGQRTYGGAISAGIEQEDRPVPSALTVEEYFTPSVVLSGNKGNISFINNVLETQEGDYPPYHAPARGGAIYSDGMFELSDTVGKTLFHGNTINGLCYGFGGAISAETGLITNNNGLEFSNNVINLFLADNDGEVDGRGGAIYTEGPLDIDHNYNGISFIENKIVVDWDAGHTYGRLYGGAIAVDESVLTIAYNRGDIVFSGNSAMLQAPSDSDRGSYNNVIAMGGAIYANSDIKLTGNYDSIIFYDNKVQGDLAGGGAIANDYNGGGGEPSMLSRYVRPTEFGNITLSGNMGKILFQKNKATGFYIASGGAIYSESAVEFLGNTGGISFINNTVEAMGMRPNGAEPSSLDEDSPLNGGGAIYSRELLTIAGNSGPIFFQNNTASTTGREFIAGGAIFSEGGVTITGNEGDVIFYNNKVTGRAPTGTGVVGGAIASAEDVTLRADKGNIIFAGNRMNSQSNAIYMLGHRSDDGGEEFENLERASNSNVPCKLNISATEGHQVVFYDGIAFTPNMFSIKLNEGGEAGTIMFSGNGTVVDTGSHRYSDYYWAPKIDTTLGGGQLVIADGALYGGIVNPGIFRVTGNASVRLEGTSSELRTEELVYSTKGTLDMAGGSVTADNAITMHHAQVLNSKGGRLSAPVITLHGGIIHDLKSPTHVIVNAEDSFAISGNLNMRDRGLDVYRTVRFSQPFEIHVLTTEGIIKDGDLDYILSETTNSHRVGDETSNQGHWEMEWRNGDKDLYALWILEKAMENPMDVVIPEEQGHLIPNSVWSTASNMNSMKESGYGQVGLTRFTMQRDTNYWVNGLGDFAIHNSVGKIDGYDYSGGGYAVGADKKWTKNFVGGLAFGQVFGTSKSRNYSASNDQKTIAGMLYGAWMKELDKKTVLLFQGSAAYGSTDNSLHTIYSDGKASRGSWDNDAWLLTLRGSWNRALKNNWTVSPFVGIEYEDITQKSFTENGDRARNFSKSDLRNLSLPIGVGITKQRDFSNGMKWFNTLELSYLPDVYRENPKSDVSCVDTSDAWTVRGISDARNALRAELYSRLFINNTWSTYAGYTLEARDHSTYHRVNLGVSATF